VRVFAQIAVPVFAHDQVVHIAGAKPLHDRPVPCNRRRIIDLVSTFFGKLEPKMLRNTVDLIQLAALKIPVVDRGPCRLRAHFVEQREIAQRELDRLFKSHIVQTHQGDTNVTGITMAKEPRDVVIRQKFMRQHIRPAMRMDEADLCPL